MQPAIFLDKDHTLIPDIPYNVDPAKIRLTPGAGPALLALQQAGYALVVVSNQAGVAKGFFPVAALVDVQKRLNFLLGAYGVHLAGFYFCPHYPEGAVPAYAKRCACRKPAPGLLYQAADDLGLDLPCSWMVGDIWSDIDAGRAAGCTTVLFTYHTDAAKELQTACPDYVAADFAEVVRIILTHSPIHQPPLGNVLLSNRLRS